MCVSGTCNDGYYREVLTLQQANASIVGDLEIGSDVCIPCDELCAQCTGPGSRLERNSCQDCKFASQGLQCVMECNITGKLL